MSRHSVLEIRMDHLLFNLELIRTYLFDHQRIIAVVKANAYGLGSVPIARKLEQEGVDFFAVACIHEAMELRKNGIQSSILVLSPFFEEEIPLFLEYRVTPTLTDAQRALSLNKKAEEKNLKIPVHFKVDTGMGRLGPRFDEAEREIETIASLKNLILEGLFSHFPSADAIDPFTSEQIDRFKSLDEALRKKGIMIPVRHTSNSSGIVAYNDPFFTAVRPGLLLYGLLPSEEMGTLIYPEPVAFWKSRLIEVKKLKKGDSVSYGRTFILDEDKTLGVVPVGYADGFSTLNSGKGLVRINGKLCPILGRVCMDYFMADLTDSSGQVGDLVEIYGQEEGIRIEDVAKRTGLIPYEIQLTVSPATERTYLFPETEAD